MGKKTSRKSSSEAPTSGKFEESKIVSEIYESDMVVLKKETKKVNDLVQQKATDDEITKALASLHDTFHKIVGLCQTENK